jgi:hypothetical protein
MTMQLVIEAIDHQLALLWKARDILATDSERPARTKLSRPAQRQPGDTIAAAKKSQATRTKKVPLAQQKLEFEAPVSPALPVPAEARLLPASPLAIAQQQSLTPPVADKPRATRRVSIKRAVATVPTAQAPRALTSSIPSGPIVVTASSAAREREEKQAKKAALERLTVTKPMSGLDALIAEASVRSGVKLKELDAGLS